MQMIIKKEKNFIDEAYLHSLLSQKEDVGLIREIIAKSMEKKPLNVSECAVLLAANDKDVVEEIFNAAKELKKRVYGNRIVIFAPLYIGNHCINDCKYCSFRKSLRTTVRKTLNEEDIVSQVEALEDQG
ncbi:MAG: thiamine biosynthesis protein ThiH, partial [uncultured bacterium]